MRREPRPVRLRVVALDQRDLLGGLSTQVVPLELVRGVVIDSVDPACAIGVNEVDGDEVVRAEGAPVGECEGLVGDGVGDGPPDVDDADARLEEAGGVLGEVVLDALNGSPVGLVDMDALLQRDK